MRLTTFLGCVGLGIVLSVPITYALGLWSAFDSPPDYENAWKRSLLLAIDNNLRVRTSAKPEIPPQVQEDLAATYDHVDGIQRITWRVECESPYNEAYKFWATKDGDMHYGIYCRRERKVPVQLLSRDWMPQSLGIIAFESTYR